MALLLLLFGEGFAVAESLFLLLPFTTRNSTLKAFNLPPSILCAKNLTLLALARVRWRVFQ
jgi:hypothetical protein